jgi:hypothetical protein
LITQETLATVFQTVAFLATTWLTPVFFNCYLILHCTLFLSLFISLLPSLEVNVAVLNDNLKVVVNVPDVLPCELALVLAGLA